MGKTCTFLAKPWEVRPLLDGSKTMIARPVKWPIRANAERDGQELREFKGLPRKTFRCPFGEPGDVLLGKECWSDSTVNIGDCLWYWADGNPECGDWTKPRSSACMPPWAVRIRLTVEAVTAKRCAEITAAEAIACGATRREWTTGRPYGWAMDWTRNIGNTWRGRERPVTEQDICLGSPQTAAGNQWEHDNPRRPWESSWAWLATVTMR